jgi:hypothetical protein
MDGETTALPFDFVGPIGTDRWHRLQQCQARLDPIGHRIEQKVRLSRIAPTSRLRFGGEAIVLQQRLGGFFHLPVRVSAATDFFKASMMLMTLLGAGAEAGALALDFDRFGRIPAGYRGQVQRARSQLNNVTGKRTTPPQKTEKTSGEDRGKKFQAQRWTIQNLR